MVAQFVRFLATVPLSAPRNSFDNLVIQAIDPTETPVSEWDFREGTFGAPEVAAIAAQHIHEDTAYIVEAQWDLWTFESETLKWKQGPQPLEIICRGPQYDDGAAASDGQHEKMHVNGALLQPFPHLLRGEPTPGQIGEAEADERERMSAKQVRSQPEHTAQEGGGQLRHPLVNFVRVFEELDVALDDFGPREVAPAPELRRGRARHSRDGDGVGIVLDGDPLALQFGERLGAGMAIALADEQGAGEFLRRFLGAANGGGDALGQLWDIGQAERGDRNGLARPVDGYGFQRRVFGQSVHDRTRQAFGGVRFRCGIGRGSRGHKIVVPF